VDLVRVSRIVVAVTGATALVGALAGPAVAVAAPGFDYNPNNPTCKVTPGTVQAGQPVSVEVTNVGKNLTVVVHGSGPVQVTTGAGKAGSTGAVTLTEGTNPSSGGDGSFTVTAGTPAKSHTCHVTVQPLALRPVQVHQSQPLPFTGASDIVPAALGALALVGVGGGLVVAGRRRRTA
jgi:hypothetical protein